MDNFKQDNEFKNFVFSPNSLNIEILKLFFSIYLFGLLPFIGFGIIIVISENSSLSEVILGFFILTKVSLILSPVLNAIVFLLSPTIMDISLKRRSRIIWFSLFDNEYLSFEIITLIRKICHEYNLKIPKFGIISSQEPIAFTYGNMIVKARVVVSQGLLDCLNNEEISGVYAHEIGHVVRGDVAIMTFALSLLQPCILIAQEPPRSWQLTLAILVAKFASQKMILLSFKLSRLREYFADYFAIKQTKDPNALSRALLKMAFRSSQIKTKSKKMNWQENIRSIGIIDLKIQTSYTISKISESMASNGYRDSDFLDRIFGEDSSKELESTHPLLINRISQLNSYCQWLDCSIEIPISSSPYKKNDEIKNSHKEQNIPVVDECKIYFQKSRERKWSEFLLAFLLTLIFLILLIQSPGIWQILFFAVFVFITILNFKEIYNPEPDFITISNVGFTIDRGRGKEILKWSEVDQLLS